MTRLRPVVPENWLVCKYITVGKCQNVKSGYYGKDCPYIQDAKDCPKSERYQA